MNKIIILIIGLFLSLTVLSDEWPHENISNAVFSLDVEDRVQLILLKKPIILWVKSTFLPISVTSVVSVLPIVGFTKVESWLMLVSILMARDGVYGHQKTCGILG